MYIILIGDENEFGKGFESWVDKVLQERSR